ncbi:multidrug ABC transporter ATPase 2 [Thermococcus cleftensis]|uniref:Multidrug ABC transporter ATPase 2 n=1 Tax=Thermococcus cleftensis (strain DSM 27260 / KACC 17922 / CL1) TaxID=163003 RepID=I3ZUN4_THECF|nr:ABC transporter ATP-binding protein [Thermococcus cleftensis]AFL95418.1 multidrug ABC transporter ATPase 2 [Thermococcus cleftensis]
MITAKNLTKRFGRLVALDSINLEIEGGLTLILGPNGGGKSTFLNLCAGLYRPSKGEIRVLGEKPWSNDGLRKRIGVSFDPPALPKHRTAREWLTYIAEVKGLDGEEVIKAAELFSAEKYLNRKMGEYSAGMLKRISLAQAFLGKPELVLLDEPLANLDLEGIKEVAGVIGELAQKGTNMVVVSHIWRPLVEFADRIVVIAAGRVVLTGTPDEVVPEIEEI